MEVCSARWAKLKEKEKWSLPIAYELTLESPNPTVDVAFFNVVNGARNTFTLSASKFFA